MTIQENIQNLLLPHAPMIVEALHYGWDTFHKTPHHAMYDKTTRANMVYNLAVEKLKTYPSFYTVKKNRTTYFSLQGQCVFRIKRTDKNGRSKNIRTGAVSDFHNPQFEFSDLPKAIKFEVGYIPNSTETEIYDIRIIFRNNAEISGSFSIVEKSNAFEQNDIEEILAAQSNANSSTGIVKVKKGLLPDQNKQIEDKK